MIKYLGSKRLLLDDIYKQIQGPGSTQTVLDVFSGTSRVGHYLKKKGFRVIANDLATYATVLADCYLCADRDVFYDDAQKLVEEFNARDFPDDEVGYFEDTFCIKSRFFHPTNGRRVDRIRDLIESYRLNYTLKCVLLTSLMEAADRVDSTCGIQMAYLKQWAPRALNPLKLRVPDLVSRDRLAPCLAYQLNAIDFVRKVRGDIAYVDPPYNQHNYLGNYHIWETLCKWDKPKTYGVACKRLDTRVRKSDFNSKLRAKEAFREVIGSLNVKQIIVSFNDEGFISREEMEEILSTRGRVLTVSKDFKRYVGAQIGIHNPQGEKVGEVSHLRNKEYLYNVEVRKGKENV